MKLIRRFFRWLFSLFIKQEAFDAVNFDELIANIEEERVVQEFRTRFPDYLIAFPGDYALFFQFQADLKNTNGKLGNGVRITEFAMQRVRYVPGIYLVGIAFNK